MNRRKSVGLTCFVAAAVATMAFVVPPASATEVTPAGTSVTATLKSSTKARIVPDNAFKSTSIACLKSEATIATPPENEFSENMNRGLEEPYEEGGAEGTFSEGPGSVIAEIEGAPVFEECGVYSTNEEGKETFVSSAEVDTLAGWSVAGFVIGEPEEEEAESGRTAALITMPPGAVVGEFLGCKIEVSTTEVTGVVADYLNGSHELVIDGQVPIKASGIFCGEVKSPAQFEAKYTVDNELEITR